jgi:hypothetical protein
LLSTITVVGVSPTVILDVTAGICVASALAFAVVSSRVSADVVSAALALGFLLVMVGFWVGTGTRQTPKTVFWIFAALGLAYALGFVFSPLAPWKARSDKYVSVAAFVMVLALYVATWALIYQGADAASAGCIRPQFRHHVDGLYFALTTFTTVGYGDFKAHTEACRWLVSGELALDIAIIGISLAGLASRMAEVLPQRQAK